MKITRIKPKLSSFNVGDALYVPFAINNDESIKVEKNAASDVWGILKLEIKRIGQSMNAGKVDCFNECNTDLNFEICNNDVFFGSFIDANKWIMEQNKKEKVSSQKPDSFEDWIQDNFGQYYSMNHDQFDKIKKATEELKDSELYKNVLNSDYLDDTFKLISNIIGKIGDYNDAKRGDD